MKLPANGVNFRLGSQEGTTISFQTRSKNQLDSKFSRTYKPENIPEKIAEDS